MLISYNNYIYSFYNILLFLSLHLSTNELIISTHLLAIFLLLCLKTKVLEIVTTSNLYSSITLAIQ